MVYTTHKNGDYGDGSLLLYQHDGLYHMVWFKTLSVDVNSLIRYRMRPHEVNLRAHIRGYLWSISTSTGDRTV